MDILESILQYFAGIPQPHWLIGLMIGSVMGVTASFFSQESRARIRRGARRFQRSHLTSFKYFTRVSFRDGKPHLTRRDLIVKRAVRHDFSFRTDSDGGDSLSYDGRADILGKFLVAIGWSCHPDHRETVVYQFPLRTPRSNLVGLSLCQDHDGGINASGVVFSQDELSDEEALQLIRRSTEVLRSPSMIRMG